MSGDELFNQIENDTKERWSRSRILRQAFDAFEKEGDLQRREEMRWETLIFDLLVKPRSAQKFSPKMSFADGTCCPDPDSFPEEAFDYFKKRVDETKNPIHKARYCHFVWDKKREYVYAQKAIDAYLECVPIYLENNWGRELADALEIAKTLTLQINDEKKLEEVVKKHYEVLNTLRNTRNFRWGIEILESLLSIAILQGQQDYATLETFCEEAIKHYKENKLDFRIQRHFLDILIEIHKQKNEQIEVENTRLKKAESFEEEAEWQRVHNPSNRNLVAAICYQDALNEYKNLGKYPQKIAELKIKIKECNEMAIKEFKPISIRQSIPTDKLENYLNSLKNLSLDEALKRLSCDRSWLPSWDKAKKKVEEDTKELALQFFVKTNIIRHGNLVAEVSETDEKLEYQALRNIMLEYKIFASVYLKEVMRTLKENLKMEPTNLTSFLSQSNIFAEEKLKLLKVGIERYFVSDYVSAIHIVVFQIEDILRTIIGKLGLPTTSERSGKTYERYLEDILDEPKLIEGIGKDFTVFLRTFLCDQRGDNLRNDVAHGLLRLENFTQENAELLIWTLIQLSSFRIENPPQTPSS